MAKKTKEPVQQPQDEVQQAVQVDVDTLDEHFKMLPAGIAHWNERYANARGRQLRAEARRKRTYAELFLEIKKTPLENSKYPSEVVADLQVKIDPRYVEAQEAEIEAEVACVRLYGVVEALRAKRDALVSFGANVRAERSGEPLIREQASRYSGRDDD